MANLIIGGQAVATPFKDIITFQDEPKLLLGPEDMRPRKTRWVRSIFLHNTKNIETVVKPGGWGSDTRLEERIAHWWSIDKRHAGAHLCVDWDGTIGQLADLLDHAAYHAGQVNEVSIGIEIYENGSGVVYANQLVRVVELVIWLCDYFGIQHQMPPVDFDGTIPRLLNPGAGRDCVGVFGHCHAYSGKRYDPGRDIFCRLKYAGFREFTFIDKADDEVNGVFMGRFCDDLIWWKQLQRAYGLKCDGVPGPLTRDALQGLGYAHGIWYPPEEA
jgi:hypothetical protein